MKASIIILIIATLSAVYGHSSGLNFEACFSCDQNGYLTGCSGALQCNTYYAEHCTAIKNPCTNTLLGYGNFDGNTTNFTFNFYGQDSNCTTASPIISSDTCNQCVHDTSLRFYATINCHSSASSVSVTMMLVVLISIIVCLF